MNAVMYGGGNIGRGFIGGLLSQSGYHVTFIDVAEPVVNYLREQGRYPIRYVSNEGHEDEWIEHVTAVDGRDAEAAAQAIADCDLMATAVGVRVLPHIIDNIVLGLRRRWQQEAAPLNIVICENLMDANKVLEGLIKEKLTEEECAVFDQRVGLVEAAIGRMVPVQTPEMKDGEPMRVCVERYGFLPVDRDGFRGEIPPVKNMVPYAPFDFYIKRKLYIHNMGHAVCAYLGDYLGLTYIHEAIAVPQIRILVQNAMQESAMAVSAKYGVGLYSIQMHTTDLLHRLTNAALRDTCARVGADPARKLSLTDRLIGAASLALEQGVTPAYITIGAAGALCRYLDETEGCKQSLPQAKAALEEIAGLDTDSELAALILDYYRMMLSGDGLKQISDAADRIKGSSLADVI